eukprot:jgi/Psemu1/3990/gm1.3990_g
MPKNPTNYTSLELKSLLKKLYHVIRVPKVIKKRRFWKADGGGGQQQYDMEQGYDEDGFLDIKEEDLFGEDDEDFPSITPINIPLVPNENKIDVPFAADTTAGAIVSMSLTPLPSKRIYRHKAGAHNYSQAKLLQLLNTEALPIDNYPETVRDAQRDSQSILPGGGEIGNTDQERKSLIGRLLKNSNSSSEDDDFDISDDICLCQPSQPTQPTQLEPSILIVTAKRSYTRNRVTGNKIISFLKETAQMEREE